jgi:hypothetical protein
MKMKVGAVTKTARRNTPKGETTMKVIAINGSPHMDKGNTAMILDPFLEGMKEAGADVDLFYTGKLKIEPCHGDLSCWLKVPGKCALNDDMQMLYPKFMDADVIVWGTPVYYLSIPGPLKNLIDRQMPLHVPGTKAEFAGALLRPHAEGMRLMLETKEGRKPVEEVLLAAKEAGLQLAKEGRISKEVLQRVSRELMPKDVYYQAANEMFQSPGYSKV